VATSLDVVVPVLNEEEDLRRSITTLHEFLSANLDGYEWRIVVADNGSTDSTPEVAKRLSSDLANVGYLRLEERGRGRALKKAWTESSADVLSYMDVDLSTDLSHFPPMVDAIRDQSYDIAIGSRLARGAQVIGRPPKRELISRAYSILFRSMFWTGFRDAQCGFKALSADAAHAILPLVRDTGWFFDSELLIVAEKNGFRIKELPVKWTDDPGSRVKIVGTAYGDLKGLLRLRFGGLRKASKALSAKHEDV
jgi:glycosyltransferase involved in cell wall biosynthesis